MQPYLPANPSMIIFFQQTLPKFLSSALHTDFLALHSSCPSLEDLTLTTWVSCKSLCHSHPMCFLSTWNALPVCLRTAPLCNLLHPNPDPRQNQSCHPLRILQIQHFQVFSIIMGVFLMSVSFISSKDVEYIKLYLIHQCQHYPWHVVGNQRIIVE